MWNPPLFCAFIVQNACILLLGSEDTYGVLRLEDFIMTQDQKARIAQLRQQKIGYASIAKELSLSINTVKAYCRRNDLAGTRDTPLKPIKDLSEESPNIDLLTGANRGNSSSYSMPESPENAEFCNAQPAWDVSVSYADRQDENAVADVLSMLMNASYGR